MFRDADNAMIRSIERQNATGMARKTGKTGNFSLKRQENPLVLRRSAVGEPQMEGETMCGTVLALRL